MTPLYMHWSYTGHARSHSPLHWELTPFMADDLVSTPPYHVPCTRRQPSSKLSLDGLLGMVATALALFERGAEDACMHAWARIPSLLNVVSP